MTNAGRQPNGPIRPRFEVGQVGMLGNKIIIEPAPEAPPQFLREAVRTDDAASPLFEQSKQQRIGRRTFQQIESGERLGHALVLVPLFTSNDRVIVYTDFELACQFLRRKPGGLVARL